jgi:transposase
LAQLKAELDDYIPKSKALTCEQQMIQTLAKKIKRLELEKEILKKLLFS